MYLCKKCYDVYDDIFLPEDKKDNPSATLHCPKSDCLGEIFKVDELILPTIMLLNKKGYITKYCCSGHLIETGDYISTYIAFTNVNRVPDIIPDNFKLDDEGDCIRYKYEQNESDDRYLLLLDINKQLYEWAKSLPLHKYGYGQILSLPSTYKQQILKMVEEGVK